MTDIKGATFYQNYCGIDIWYKQNTVTGTTIYFINADGTTHERQSEKEIINLAKFIVRTRGSR